MHVFDPRRPRSLRFGDVAVHTSADARAFRHLGPVRTTTEVDTVIDLARSLPPAFGLAVADAAARRFAVTTEAIEVAAARQRNPRGRRRLEWTTQRLDPRAESVAESISRAVAEWCGFPPPVLQAEHRIGGRRYRSDLCWPQHRVIGECDGWSKYGTGESAVGAVREEKVREDALRRAGWRVARWDYAGALHVDGLRTALEAAGLPRTRPEDSAHLFTLRHAPRSIDKRRGE